MPEIIPLLQCLEACLSSTELRQLSHVVFAMLCIAPHVTMLGLSWWTEKGGSYRTLQRLYHSRLNWAMLHWQIIKTHLLRAESRYILAADEVVVSKAGQKTYGVGRFYSGLAGRSIPSLSFFALALIDVEARCSYPLQVEQLLPAAVKQVPAEAPVKRPRGRPKASQNHVKPVPT
jgi:putative transposase